MKNFISAVTALILVFTLSVGAFAFDCDVFSAGAVEGFSEDAENKTDVYVQYLKDGDDATAMDNYNVYYLENNAYNLTAAEMLKQSGGEEKIAKDYGDAFAKQLGEQGFTAEIKSISAKLHNMNGYDCVLISCDYIMTDSNGNSSECFLSQIAVPRQKVTVYVSSTTDDGESSAELLENASKLLTIHAKEPSGNTLVVRLVVALVIIVALIGGAAVIRRKKKKQNS